MPVDTKKSVFGLPPEYATEIEQAELRKQLAAAMLSRGSTPVEGKMVGKHYVRSNPLQHLAQILNQTFQRQGLDHAQKEIGDIRRKAASDESAERRSILEPLSDSNWRMPDPRGELAYPVDFPVPADPMEAERRGMAAKFGSNRELGDALMKRRMELFKAGADHAGGPSVIRGVRLGGDPNALVEKTPPKIQTDVTPDGTPLIFTENPDDGKTTFELGRKPSSVSATATAGDKFGLEGFKHVAGQVEKSLPLATGAQQSLLSTQEALAALDAGAETGLTQPIQQVVRKLASDLGVEGTGADAYDLLASRLKAMVIQRAGGLGRQISDADRAFLEGATGSTMTDPKALRRMLAIGAAVDMMTLSKHNSRIAQGSAAFPESRDILKSDSIDWKFSPGKETDKLIQAVLKGKSTFEVMPAEKQGTMKGLVSGEGGEKPGEDGLTDSERKELEELRGKIGVRK